MGQQHKFIVGYEGQDGQRITASSGLVSAIYLAAKNLGARKPVLLKMLNMMESHLRHPDGRFDLSAVTAIAASTIVETQSAEVAGAFARQMQPHSFSDIGYCARFAGTVHEALNALIAEMGWEKRLSPLRLEMQVPGQCGQGRISWAAGYVHSPETEAILLQFLTQYLNDLLPVEQLYPVPRGHSVFRELSMRPAAPIATPSAPAERFSGQFVLSEKGDAVEFPVTLLDQSSRHARPEIFRLAQAMRVEAAPPRRRETPVTDLTYRYLVPLLDKSGLSLAAAAKSFGLAERTMRRRLAAEGTCFRDVLEMVRRDICALYFLENRRSLSRIAARLGYSELSAFTRAYTAWHGHPPSADYSPAKKIFETA